MMVQSVKGTDAFELSRRIPVDPLTLENGVSGISYVLEDIIRMILLRLVFGHALIRRYACIAFDS